MVMRGLALQPVGSGGRKRRRERRREQRQEVCDLWVPLKKKRNEEKVDQWKVSLFLQVIFTPT